MKGKRMQGEWSGLSDEVMEEVAARRAQHSKVTLREIGVEIDRACRGCERR